MSLLDDAKDSRDAVVDDALEALDADALRALIRGRLPWLDDATRSGFEGDIVDRAARGAGAWAPAAPSERRVREIEIFADAARRECRADPADVDDCLREGMHAFLAGDHAAAIRIFLALLVPIGRADIDLGQAETPDEVLGVDLDACARQYLVARYLAAGAEDRARVLASALDDVDGVACFFDPLRAIESASLGPLPDWEGFLSQWLALLEARRADAGAPARGVAAGRWLRDAILRVHGRSGLAALARRSGDAEDLRAWCRAEQAAGDWAAVRAACEEAAGMLEASPHDRAALLDGAALAAQELGTDDLDLAFEHAWRAAPTLIRLCRWLGGCPSPAALQERAEAALASAPEAAQRQRALLLVLSGRLDLAADLLAAAPGLGWSWAEHPGRLLFPVFITLLTGSTSAIDLPSDASVLGSLAGREEPQLRTPGIEELLRRAAVRRPPDARSAATMVRALRAAAEHRVDGVVANKRRSHYVQAVTLAMEAARTEGSGSGWGWLRELRARYSRYPALQRAFRDAQ